MLPPNNAVRVDIAQLVWFGDTIALSKSSQLLAHMAFETYAHFDSIT